MRVSFNRGFLVSKGWKPSAKLPRKYPSRLASDGECYTFRSKRAICLYSIHREDARVRVLNDAIRSVHSPKVCTLATKNVKANIERRKGRTRLYRTHSNSDDRTRISKSSQRILLEESRGNIPKCTRRSTRSALLVPRKWEFSSTRQSAAKRRFNRSRSSAKTLFLAAFLSFLRSPPANS